MKRITVNDIFPNALEDTPIGFFTYLETWALANQIEIPFFDDPLTSGFLDLAYHGNHSGQKLISPLVHNLSDDEPITAANAMRIAGMWYAMYGENIKKQYSILSLEYNPIQNYDMTESGTDTDSGTETTTRNGQKADTHIGQTKTENKVFGFDSTSGVSSDETTNTIGLNNVPLTDTTTYTNLQDEKKLDTEHGHSLSRSGNIGVTTSQQMIQSEIELWKWNFFENYLFPCVDMVLTIPIY